MKTIEDGEFEEDVSDDQMLLLVEIGLVIEISQIPPIYLLADGVSWAELNNALDMLREANRAKLIAQLPQD